MIFDGAADDAIAFLNIIEHTESNVDISRVAVNGGSRGGTVALLMSERDESVKLVTAIVSPTNMLALTAKNENDETYQCQFLSGLVNGDVSIADSRHLLIASSPIFFAQNLSQTQLHFAGNDEIVPVSQGEMLAQKMNDLGLNDIFELYIYEDRSHQDIGINNQEMRNRIEEFLSQL